MIDERKIELITRLVDEYISTAHPVGSLFLVERYRLSWSSATIRNEMALLEADGFMFQPYTSSGRVPTEHGYRLYIEHMKPGRISARQTSALAQTVRSLKNSSASELKKLCRLLAELSGEIAFISVQSHMIIAGMHNLCHKPEFHDTEFMAELTSVLDNLEESVQNIINDLSDEPALMIGDEEHFSKLCSVVLLSATFLNTELIIGIIGPLRMNYGKNTAFLQTLSTILTLNP